jgi:ATP-dependent protease Clp ATPase subunit
VAKLIAGPKVYICDACVGAGEQVLRGVTPTETAGGAQMELVPLGSRVRCSFCRRKSSHAVTKLKRVYDKDIDDVADYMVTHAEKTDSSLGLRIVKSGDKSVCDKCLQICRRILDDRSEARR